MAVITTDILLTGIRRDDVLAWLSEPANQRVILDGAFDGIKELGDTHFELTVNCSPKTRVIGYRFVKVYRLGNRATNSSNHCHFNGGARRFHE